ncbi:MAG: VOC family protein [Betaproteobacteria bacterium]|jgi:catechol 2,3-dioxygenase|nr:VOC family protein [Betaproteobacteria bacterium]
MKIRELGHVVLQVVDLDRSLPFYRDTLGLPLVSLGAPRGRRMAFFSLGAKHHDLALLELGPGAGPNDHSRAGVFHVAFKVGDDIEALREAKARIDAAGVPVVRVTEHVTTLSLYVSDPDGITVELFIDTDPATWRDHPHPLGELAKPLVL